MDIYAIRVVIEIIVTIFTHNLDPMLTFGKFFQFSQLNLLSLVEESRKNRIGQLFVVDTR